MKEDNKFYWLDLIRGLAALAVFTGHLRIIFFRDVPVYELPLLGKIVFFVSGFSHSAVVLFFTLSGFLIIYSIHEAVLQKRWTFSNYSFNRLIRLWVVLIPCLALGLFWDKLGLALWGDSVFYSNHWKYFLNQDLASKLSPTIFLGNMFFLQKIFVPTLGSNGSLWSLTNEFWYYVVFPLFYFASFNFYNIYIRLIFLIAGILILFIAGSDISVNFIIWLMGGLSYILVKYLNPDFLKRKLWMYILTALFLFIICMERSKFYPYIFNYYSIGMSFSLLIPFLTKTPMKNNMIKSIAIYLSDISYTLYLAHLPIIYVLTSMIGYENMAWSTKNFFVFLIVTIIVFMYSRLIWYVFERNTKKIKKWFSLKKTFV